MRDLRRTPSPTGEFAHQVVDYLVEQRPKALTLEQRKAKRRGRIFVDILRTAYSQTAIAPCWVRGAIRKL